MFVFVFGSSLCRSLPLGHVPYFCMLCLLFVCVMFVFLSLCSFCVCVWVLTLPISATRSCPLSPVRGPHTLHCRWQHCQEEFNLWLNRSRDKSNKELKKAWHIYCRTSNYIKEALWTLCVCNRKHVAQRYYTLHRTKRTRKCRTTLCGWKWNQRSFFWWGCRK